MTEQKMNDEIITLEECRARLEKLERQSEIIDELIENAYEGMVIVDAKGYITKFNYVKLLGIQEADALGKPVAAIIENTGLPRVLETGKAEIGAIQTINGKDMVVSRIPFKKNGRVVGAIGTVMFRDVNEVKHLAKKVNKLESKVNLYKREIDRIHQAKYEFEDILTVDRQMKQLIDLARKSAEMDTTILIDGESGTGKEYFAHAIHNGSERRYKPFVRINCGAIPRELIETELFGYDEGAFTGARKSGKIGKFELANGGTIFLDEIGTLPIEMQAKLLRVLEEREVERIGSNNKIHLDIRVIAATNVDLKTMVEEKTFREDLYYRLNVIRISLPPLREREGDVALLSEHILKQFAEKYHKGMMKIAPVAMQHLANYDWPGNIRELRNIVERAFSVANGQVIYTRELPDFLIQKDFLQNSLSQVNMSLKDVVAAAECQAITAALKLCDGNKTEAAKHLGIHRTQLYKKMLKYKMDEV